MGDDGFRVAPDALRKMAQRLGQIATLYENAKGWTQGLMMPHEALGLLGEMVRLPPTYNEATLQFQLAFQDSGQRTRDAERALNKTAEVYEDKDAEWWRKFGYLD